MNKSLPLVLLYLLLKEALGIVNLSRSELLQHLMKNYSNKVPPNFDLNDPIKVQVGIYINSFDSINESTMDYAMSIFLRQHWIDQRLAYVNISNEKVLTLDSRSLHDLWVPDLFFANEKEGHFHHVTVPNTFIRMYPNGSIQYSARISLVFSCPMLLHKYPMDIQVCSMMVETYAYSMEQLVFEWNQQHAVEINDDLALSQFRLNNITLHNIVKNYYTGSFSGLEVKFYLERDLGYYMIQTYIPSMLIVFLSWVSFWLSYDAVPARISLGVLTVLTMTTMTSGMSTQLPRVSYVKAMDVWLSTCQFFVFAALVEFAFVNWLTRRELKRVHSKKQKQCKASNGSNRTHECSSDGTKSLIHEHGHLGRNNVFNSFHRRTWIFGQSQSMAERLDSFAQPLFPLAFFIFNLVYWPFYYFWQV